jgi:drug/metabolite transporter (DMT)-like permease
VPATQAGAFVNIEPVMGALLGVAVLGDRLGPLGIVGGLLIVGSALRFTLRGRVAGAPPTPPT